MVNCGSNRSCSSPSHQQWNPSFSLFPSPIEESVPDPYTTQCQAGCLPEPHSAPRGASFPAQLHIVSLPSRSARCCSGAGLRAPEQLPACFPDCAGFCGERERTRAIGPAVGSVLVGERHNWASAPCQARVCTALMGKCGLYVGADLCTHVCAHKCTWTCASTGVPGAYVLTCGYMCHHVCVFRDGRSPLKALERQISWLAYSTLVTQEKR